MKTFIMIFVLLIFSCKDGKKYHDTAAVSIENQEVGIQEIIAFQQELNKEYKDPESSPLSDNDRVHFEGLDFFEPDLKFRVEAKFERTPDAIPFLMATTTDRKSKEVVFGFIRFTLNAKDYVLEVYQNSDVIQRDGYADYLFLPFLDQTNTEETYGGGRYIDLRIPEGNTIIIDFNKAYNPYCAYNKKYSCPIVPKVNSINAKILAGVKAFKH